MSETVKNVDLKVMGARFQKIRQRLQLKQTDVAKAVGCSMITVSRLERGENISASVFLSMLLFYMKTVSLDMLLSNYFDPDDDDLYQKNAPMNSFIKANLEQLREDAEANIRNTQEGFKRNVDEALSQINDLLKKTLNEQMRNCTQDQQEKLRDRLDKVIGLL
jgi:transcriptional regulator with XRE-family HTH domain